MMWYLLGVIVEDVLKRYVEIPSLHSTEFGLICKYDLGKDN